MRRREFIVVLGGAAATWPLAVRGQQKARYPTIGLVGSASTDGEETRRVFESACSEFGWVEGRNIHIVYRAAEFPQMRAVLAELVASSPDVIVANGDDENVRDVLETGYDLGAVAVWVARPGRP